jgi:hypothetical protein
VLGATGVCLFGGGGGGGAEVGVQRSDGYGGRARPARQSSAGRDGGVIGGGDEGEGEGEGEGEEEGEELRRWVRVEWVVV